MKLSVVLLAFALAAPILAGCLGGKTVTQTTTPDSTATLSPAIYKIRAPESMPVAASSDGKLLENAVYRPDTNESVPVYINFSPYWGDSAMKEGDHFSQYMIHEYVPRGYAVVLSSVRGTGHSEGCFQVGGDLELKDTYDVVDFFSKQSWSTGNIGAGAKSYDATTQNGMIAKFPHPALKTIFHVSGITDMYRYNGKDGVTYANGLSFTPRYAAGQGTDEYGLPSGTGGGSPNDDSPSSLARLADDAACPEMAKHIQSGEGTAASGIKDAYWQERDWIHYLPSSSWNGSVFFVHGLQDWNVKPDNIDPWLQELGAKGIQVKGWLHQWQQAGTGHVYPMRTDWNVTMLRWLDHYLKSRDNGIDTELGFDIMGTDKAWRHSAEWPPVAIDKVVSTAAGQSTTDAVVSPGGLVRYAGTPYATVTITSTSPDPILYAAIVDVAKDGSRTIVNEAAKRIALTDDLSGPRPWVPGSSGSFNLTFYPMDIEVAPGHLLQLQVGAPPATSTTVTNADFVISPLQASGTTYNSGELHMPQANIDLGATVQPASMKCFTC